MAEPLISIKKPDGTFVKVTMAEFLAMKKQKNVLPASSAPSASSSQPVSVSADLVPNKKSENAQVSRAAIAHHGGAKPAQSIHIKHDVGQKKDVSGNSHKPLTSADARSPLEEKIVAKSNAPLTSHKREGQVEEVVRRLGFGVGPDLSGRFKSLVLARLKDIKSEDDVRSVLMRPVASGGFGLAKGQADTVVGITREVHAKHHIATRDEVKNIPVLKGKSGMSLMVEPPELPAIATDVSPKKYNEVYQAQQAAPSRPDLVPANDVVSRLVKESLANEPVFTISTKSTPKQFVQDISAPDIEMGPVEELRSITLGDFRKLSSSPEEAAKRLQQKILNLQAESFVWYLDGLSAYHSSPLYLEYIQAVFQSLAERKSLASVLMMKNSIKLSEVLAILEMEKSL